MSKIIEKDLNIIHKLIQEHCACDYKTIERMGGLTNHTYKVLTENDELLVARVPGDGTEKMISRTNEKVSAKLACDLGIDTEIIYFGNDGVKLTKYIENAQTLHKDSARENLEAMAKTLAILHNSNVDTKIPFDVFGTAKTYEDIINQYNVEMYEDYAEVKETVLALSKVVNSRKVVTCHNDPLCENWVKSDDKLYLIDWEYAGMNDPLWDLAAVSIEAELDEELDKIFVDAYIKDMEFDQDLDLNKVFIANKIYVDYLWTLWAKTRVPFDGQDMEDWANERYQRLKNNLKLINK